MSETRWNFYEPISGNNTIGLYHGNESGHVVVYHNSRVVIVDFLIKRSKSYSIYINEQLVHLNIKKKSSAYDYSMEIVAPEPPQSLWDRCGSFLTSRWREAFA